MALECTVSVVPSAGKCSAYKEASLFLILVHSSSFDLYIVGFMRMIELENSLLRSLITS